MSATGDASRVKIENDLKDLFRDEEMSTADASAPSAGIDSLMDDKKTLDSLSDLSNPLVMLTFYRRLLPWNMLFLWLNQSKVPNRQFTHREFAFTLQNEAYLRYKSFATADDLKKEVIRLNPARFEIGPVYTGRPKDRLTLVKSTFKPTLRELVFDIDMTDYDGIRTCCSDKAICKKCWKFIATAVKILDRVLREDFGFKHLLWVYSGRRGIHLWISDPEALALTDEQRKALLSYIEINRLGKNMDKRLDLRRPLHPSIADSYDALKAGFASVILKEQDCFRQPAQWDTLLALLPEKEISIKLHKDFENKKDASSKDRWKAILSAPTDVKTVKMSEKGQMRYQNAVQDIIVQYMFPRIDAEVSKHLNHLLKSPFCIHPGTGRVCVPLTLPEIETFDPESVPTVGQLLFELDAAAKQGDTKAGWESTSLRSYVLTFEQHVNAIVGDNKTTQDDRDGMEF